MLNSLSPDSRRQYLAYVRACGDLPPNGLWTEEIHRRCMCMRPFLESFILKNYGDTVDLKPTHKAMTSQCHATYGEDWLGYCASLLDKGNYPEPYDRYPLAFEAGVKYLVNGEYEHLYVPEEVINWSYKKVKEVITGWFTNSL